MAAITRVGLEMLGPGGETFRVTDLLGAGAFAEVYRAVGTESGMVVAVKVLGFPEEDDGQRQIALLNEIKTAAQVTHPNVVRVLYVDDGSIPELGPYLVMEYLPGGTLAKTLGAQVAACAAIPLGRAREMMIDIAQGAKAINERLVHRDIRPDNILIDGSHLKIADFGISKFAHEGTRDETFKGSQHIRYMAPEGWEGGTNTFKLDTYSVGIVFFEILTLKHPLAQAVRDLSDWREWERVHLFETCPDIRGVRSEVTAPLAQLIQRMLNKRAQDRPDWDEVLRILTTLESPKKKASLIRGAVEAAIRKADEQRRAQLARAARVREEENRKRLYRYSCIELLRVFDRIVEDFNSEFQHGKISVQREALEDDVVYIHSMLDTRYSLPSGGEVECYFFPDVVGRAGRVVKVRGATVIGGGMVGIGEWSRAFHILELNKGPLWVRRGRSANLVLLRDGEGDLYGRWVVCEIDVATTADVPELVGKFGITDRTVFPFGFEDPSDFCDQVPRRSCGGHVFRCSFKRDVARFFAELVKDAIEACG
jgi:serine/threonine protein kinase